MRISVYIHAVNRLFPSVERAVFVCAGTVSVAAAKILTKYAEDHKDKFTVKAGFVDGGVIDAAKVAELGKLPNRETLLSMLCSALQGNIRGLAVAINAIAEKNGEGAPAEEAAAE